MGSIATVLFITVFAYVFYASYRKASTSRREKLIEGFSFPPSLSDKLIEKYPHLSRQQADRVVEGMREYFHVCNIGRHRMIAMPSQAVDVAWHEFILFTREYKKFCDKALGRFLHHTPAEAMASQTEAQKGIQRAWKISCAREGIAPRAPNKLPLLFALDVELEIPDGFKYSLNCVSRGNDNYCASHIGCGSGCSSCSGDSGCSSGCGGD